MMADEEPDEEPDEESDEEPDEEPDEESDEESDEEPDEDVIIASAVCPHCGALNTFPGFATIEMFFCAECREWVVVPENRKPQ